jgi:hypothetical protein
MKRHESLSILRSTHPLVGLAVCALLCPVPFSFAQTQQALVTALLDGMTIVTSDSMAVIEVRSKSFGPGFCEVEVTAARGSEARSIRIASPPLAWSNWEAVASHTGTTAYQLSTRELCDTGALFEVRYFPDA